MKILMLHNDYLSMGGEYLSVREEAEGLSSLGHDVRLETVDNLNIARASPSQKIRLLLNDRSSEHRVAHALREFEPDIVHAQNLFPLLGANAINAMKKSGVPWVRTLRNYRTRCIAGTCFLAGETCTRCPSAARGLSGVVHKCYQGSRAASAGAVAYASRERTAEHEYPPRAYIVLSRAMREFITPAAGDARLVIKPNAVAPQRSRPMERQARDIGVLYAGRFAEEKDVSTIVRVAAQLPNVPFTLIGDGPTLNGIKAASQRLPNVAILGSLQHDELMETMARAVVVVVPSAWAEPFGRVAAEALACGTPAITSDQGGLPEIVEPVDPMLTVRPESGNTWKTAIERVVRMGDAEYQDLCLRALERWRGTYSPAVTARRLYSIYSEAVSSS